MQTVFVTNKSGHDYTPAEAYGRLVYISEGQLDRFNLNEMYRLAADAVKYATEADYILVTSLSVLNAIVCSVFGRKFGRLNILLYKNRRYVLRTIMLDQLL
jgi:hypothetical protein